MSNNLQSKKHTVLIVDDEEHNLDELYLVLDPIHNVKMAKDGKTAVKIAEDFQPDIILLDMFMPDVSGCEILARLKASDLTKKIPVILLTDSDNSQEEGKGVLLGAIDFIEKPFSNLKVKLIVEKHLEIIKRTRTIERLRMYSRSDRGKNAEF